MKNSDMYIFVTQDKLADFSRYNLGLSDLLDDDFTPFLEVHPENVECEGIYMMQLQDLLTALENFKSENVDMNVFLFDWWYPTMRCFYNNLCLNEIMPSPDDIGDMEVPSLPLTEEDMMLTVFNIFGRITTDKRINPNNKTLDQIVDLDSMIDMVTNFIEDLPLPIEQRRYTQAQQIAFINHWNNSMMLEDASVSTKHLFRQFTDELCEKNVFAALKAKAYACYGGNCIYACDFNEAARLLEILWRNFSFGYAANTLGYIYYYGKVTNDVPDYERAFYYFSVASTFEITEAKYKLADMFINGYYVQANPPLAINIYSKLYSETKYSFISGDFSNNFADCALRMSNAYAMIPNMQYRRYSALLEAKFALQKRMEDSSVRTDIEIKNRIEASLSKALADLKGTPNYKHGSAWQSLANGEAARVIDDFVNSGAGSPYLMHCRRLKDGKIKITLKRHPKIIGITSACSLCVEPWFEFCGLVSKLEFAIESGPGTKFLDSILNKKLSRTNFDAITADDMSSYYGSTAYGFLFFKHGTIVCKIITDKIYFYKPKDESGSIPRN